MSERWGTCRVCKGFGYSLDIHHDCYLCEGTGFDGSSELYLKEEQRKEEMNFPDARVFSSSKELGEL